jgi:death-on-curing protein
VTDPVWVDQAIVLAIHDEQIAEHGGAIGVRDIGLPESALDRPINLFHYDNADLIELAASYGYAIVRNHAFVDGNKRTSAVVTELFLDLNGLELTASDAEVVTTWLALADKTMGEKEFVAWLRGKVAAAS